MMFNSKFTTLILVALCALFARLIYSMVIDPQVISDINSNEQVRKLTLEASSVREADSLADRSEFDEITQRSLFSSTRQPEEKEEEEIVEEEVVEQPVLQQPDLKLVGIALIPEASVALIQNQNQPTLQRVKLNENIEGWELVEINSSSVVLGSGDQRITLEIERKANPSFFQKESDTVDQADNEDVEDKPLDQKDPQEVPLEDSQIEEDPIPESQE